MGVKLTKGKSLSLNKEDPTVRSIMVGLGWQERESDGEEFDLDASCFMLKPNGKVRSDADLIFYNQTEAPNGCVQHTGDDRVGGDGSSDCEQILVELEKVPDMITQLVFVVTIHEARKRNQNFGQVRKAYIRVVNRESNNEILRYDLTEEASTNIGMVFGIVNRKDGEWRFKAVGEGVQGGLEYFCDLYGIEVEG